ncbi:MAG: hypothetical protein KF851_15365 [Pirellulaceae bacterium]|nr:hypothetical protein [Pirellulaceae bacterium]
MRAIKLLCLAVITLVFTSSAYGQWPGIANPGQSRFWMEAGGAVFSRPGGDLGLGLITNTQTNEILFSSDQLSDMQSTVGPNLRIGSTNRFGIEWEASTQFGRWTTDEEFFGPNLTSPFIDPQLSPDVIGVGYDSQFFDFQFNLRKSFAPGMTFLIGPRYFRMTEDLRLNTETLVDAGFFDFLLLSENLVDISNSAIGGTIGFEFNQPVSQLISVQGHVKASGLANQGRMSRSEFNNLDVVLLDDRIDKSGGMFIGQAGGRMYFDIAPGRAATYLGYEANWLDGVANAPSQDFAVGGNEMKLSNTIFWHTIHFGLRFSY